MAAVITVSLARATTLRAQSGMVECSLRKTSAATYTGRCAENDTTVALLVLQPPSNPTRGRWQGVNARIFGHGGDTGDVLDWTAFSPAFVDIGSTGQGVFASTLGWLPTGQVAFDSAGLRFSADRRATGPASEGDLRILRVARAYFADSTRWNPIDTRRSAVVTCPAAPQPRTLFCAFYVASQEVAGEFYGGRPAGAALQAAIRSASTRRYQHPLTDFNNDSAVTFTVIQSVFDAAIRRVEAELIRLNGS